MKLITNIVALIIYYINASVLATYLVQDWQGEEVDIKIIKAGVLSILTFLWLREEK